MEFEILYVIEIRVFPDLQPTGERLALPMLYLIFART